MSQTAGERPRTAFVLAAGRGLRLRPLTARRPKPLVPFGEQPLVVGIFQRLRSFGIERIILNTHHGAAWFDTLFPEKRWEGIPLLFRHEESLLDTGGGLANIADLWPAEEDNLLLWNGDVLADPDLESFWAEHARHPRRESTLLLRGEEEPRQVTIDGEGTVVGIRHTDRFPDFQHTLYCGIALLRRRLLDRIPRGHPSSIVTAWSKVIAEGEGGIGGWVDDHGPWQDLGSIPRLLAARAARSGLGVPANPAPPPPWKPLRAEGSARCYYQRPDHRFLLCQFDPAIRENHLFVPLARHFRKAGLPVPEVRQSGESSYEVEDLGSLTLEAAAAALDEPAVTTVLGECGRTLARLHGLPAPADVELQPSFRDFTLAWEHRYFRQHCLEGVFGIGEGDPLWKEAGKELEELRTLLAAEPPRLLHRDFQSRNIVVRGGVPHLVDFQGARFGPAVYDLGSLLFDPYIDWPPTAREALVRGYESVAGPIDPTRLTLGGIQRLLQALGAYGNLSLNRGLPSFFPYLGSGIDRLRPLVGSMRETFPQLLALVEVLHRDWQEAEAAKPPV